MKYYLRYIDSADCFLLTDESKKPIEDSPNSFLLAFKTRGLSMCTVRSYGFDLVIFYRWLYKEKIELAELTESILLEFISSEQKRKLSHVSINRRLSCYRQLYLFYHNTNIPRGREVSTQAPHYKGSGYDHSLGIWKLPKKNYLCLRVKTPWRIIEPLTAKEVNFFLEECISYRDLGIVSLMLFCGLRSCEVRTIEISNINFEDGAIKVKGKGNKERVLPLTQDMMTTLKKYIHLERPSLSSSNVLFTIQKGKKCGSPMTEEGLRNLFRYKRNLSGILKATPHRFRHTFGADMARSGVRLPTLQKMMGHADGKTTLGYISLSITDIAEEYHRAMSRIKKAYETTK